MARLFDDGSTEYLYVDSTPITAAPFTMACWARSNDDTAPQGLVWLGDKDAPSDYWSIMMEGHVSQNVGFYANDSSAVTARSTTTFTQGVWHHVCGIEYAADDRAVLLDGAGKGTETTARTPDNADRVGIGAWCDSTVNAHMSGDIAEVALWNVALTDAEVAILAAGYSPLLVRPQSLVFYCPLIRDNDEDIVGGLSLTANGAPTVSAHPPVQYVTGVQIGIAAGAAPSHSASPSESESASPSLSESASPSESESASPSLSESASPSESESASPSASASASPSPGPTGSVCWGHDTGVLETNIENFQGNWTGTGTIENPGVADTERLALEATEYMISEIVNTGVATIELLQNEYQDGDDVDMDYRHGATAAACTAAAWNNYVAQFESLGFVQIRLTSTL